MRMSITKMSRQNQKYVDGIGSSGTNRSRTTFKRLGLWQTLRDQPVEDYCSIRIGEDYCDIEVSGAFWDKPFVKK